MGHTKCLHKFTDVLATPLDDRNPKCGEEQMAGVESVSGSPRRFSTAVFIRRNN